jgi:hypothetical protein
MNPALLAVLPLLEKVLTPETIQALLEQPAKLTGAVADGIVKVGNVAIDHAKAENDWIAKFNPGIDDSDIISLMKGAGVPRVTGLGLARPQPPDGVGRDLRYRRVESVELHFRAGPTERINGQTRVSYLLGRDLGFELDLRTRRRLPDPVLEVALKDPGTLETLWRRRVRTGPLDPGPLPGVVPIPAGALARLPASEDYVVTAALVWRDRQGRPVGTSRTLNVTLVGPLTFDRLEGPGTPRRLDDVEAFRSFWHKVWQQSFGPEARRFELDCKYYVALDPARERNGRMDSVVDLERTARTRRAGRLESGLLIAPEELAALAQRLGGRPLSAEAREALRTSELADRISYAARTKVEFAPGHGSAGDSVALWVYPEFQLQQAIFKRARDVDPYGRVLRFDEHAEPIPVPVAVHFLGVSTGGAS